MARAIMAVSPDTATPPVSPAREEVLPATRKFSVDEYLRMAEAGILDPDERLELIDGVIYPMAPTGRSHRGHLGRLLQFFSILGGNPPRWLILSQSTLELDRRNAPEPDLLLVRPREDFYVEGPDVQSADVFLVIEVARSSLERDRRKAALYARFGAAEYWILNLVDERVEMFRQPDHAAGRYELSGYAAAGQTLALAALPDVSVPAAYLLGAAGGAPPPGRSAAGSALPGIRVWGTISSSSQDECGN